MIHIEDAEQFEKIISNGITLIDFYATWCGPCRMLSPIIEEIAEDYKEKINVAKVDVDECSSIAAKYGINAIPAVLVFKDNELVKTNVGFMPKDTIVDLLEETLAE